MLKDSPKKILAVIEAKIFMICVYCQSQKKNPPKILQRSGCLLVSKATPKLFFGLYLIHKRRNVKFKIYLELSYFCATYPTLTRNHGRHRPYIHIKSTPAGQQLPYKTKLHVKKTRGGAYLAPPPFPPTCKG